MLFEAIQQTKEINRGSVVEETGCKGAHHRSFNLMHLKKINTKTWNIPYDLCSPESGQEEKCQTTYEIQTENNHQD